VPIINTVILNDSYTDLRKRKELSSHIKFLKLPNGILHRVIAATPIIATNMLAVFFQWRFAQAALGHNPFISALFSLTLESIAISIAYHAHLARIANLRSTMLRMASIVVALGIATLNGSHEFHSSIALAATAFGCSAISPWLWGIYSTQVSSIALARAGQLDYAPIRLGNDRWIYHPIRSFQVKRDSSWSGERNLHRAITVNDKRAADKAINKAAEKNSTRINDGI
jgi:hypothetical protein